MTVSDLPAVNASLNGLATVLLCLGYVYIKKGRVEAHRNLMLSAFGTSVVFLICYVIYHFNHPSTRFAGPEQLKTYYLCLLFSHIVLAALVPPLSVWTIYLGLRGNRAQHRRLARLTFPIWFYVSVTGVAIYLILYQIYPSK